MSQIEQDTRSKLLCCFSEGFFRGLREYRDSVAKASCDPLQCCSCFRCCCCARGRGRNGNSFLEIARLLSNLFRDLNVSVSDVAAGLVLLRKFQRLQHESVQSQADNETYQFLSGVAVTPHTHFLDINVPEVYEEIELITHYMEFALGVYGWPMYLMTSGAGKGCACSFLQQLRCLCCLWKPSGSAERNQLSGSRSVVIEDNCCLCNFAALNQMLVKNNPNVQVIYVSYHVNVNETPFLIALDHERRTVVVSVRGTLSLHDVITDLNADGEALPVIPPRPDWIGHQGMVKAAQYIRSKLVDDGLLRCAFSYSTELGTSTYDLVLVGHSLGAGTAAILAILLKKSYPNLVCYAYSPPGGTLSISAVEASKDFVTSIVLGKDVVPRIGLHQIDALRSDLMNAISHSSDPKWKIIMRGVMCCSCDHEPVESDQLAAQMLHERTGLRHSESNITLNCSEPLFPPGKIIHIVRSHPKSNHGSATDASVLLLGEALPRNERSLWRKLGLGQKEEDSVYFQALWSDPRNFDRVLVSPSMIQDHMPDAVLAALRKLLTKTGPTKPKRAVPDKIDFLMSLHGEPLVLDPFDSLTTLPSRDEVVSTLPTYSRIYGDAGRHDDVNSLLKADALLETQHFCRDHRRVENFADSVQCAIQRIAAARVITEPPQAVAAGCGGGGYLAFGSAAPSYGSACSGGFGAMMELRSDTAKVSYTGSGATGSQGRQSSEGFYRAPNPTGAPLASPETLSETSSVGASNDFVNNAAHTLKAVDPTNLQGEASSLNRITDMAIEGYQQCRAKPNSPSKTLKSRTVSVSQGDDHLLGAHTQCSRSDNERVESGAHLNGGDTIKSNLIESQLRSSISSFHETKDGNDSVTFATIVAAQAKPAILLCSAFEDAVEDTNVGDLIEQVRFGSLAKPYLLSEDAIGDAGGTTTDESLLQTTTASSIVMVHGNKTAESSIAATYDLPFGSTLDHGNEKKPNGYLCCQPVDAQDLTQDTKEDSLRQIGSPRRSKIQNSCDGSLFLPSSCDKPLPELGSAVDSSQKGKLKWSLPVTLEAATAVGTVDDLAGGTSGAEVGWLASCSSNSSATTEDETRLSLEETRSATGTKAVGIPTLRGLHHIPKEQDYDGDVDETASERSSSQMASSAAVQSSRQQYYYYDFYDNSSDNNVNAPAAPAESAL